VIALRQRRRKSRRIIPKEARESLGCRAAEQRGLALAVRDQALELQSTLCIARAQRLDELGSPLGGRIEQRVHERRKLGPLLG
jgi:hypothetical protein